MSRHLTAFDSYQITPGDEWAAAKAEGGDGYDRMDAVFGRWHPLSGWGCDGWDMLDWPDWVAYIHRAEPMAATDCEGDITVWSFPDVTARTRFLDQLAVDYWAGHLETNPELASLLGLTDAHVVGQRQVDAFELPDRFRGPFSWARNDEEVR